MYSRDYYNRILRDASRELRGNPTPAEEKLWKEYLRYLKPNAKRQRPMGSFIVDFYIPKAKLIIELDGNVHFNEKSSQKDRERDGFFESLGIAVLRFENHQVISKFDYVCKKIERVVCSRTNSPRPSLKEREPHQRT